MSPVVLVHGFWHGPWCWSLVTEELAARGIPSVAVDLDGHGLKSRSPSSRWERPFDPAASPLNRATPNSGVSCSCERTQSEARAR
jgi:pimeloyl-ACP methyl ester carboxylesterase